MFGSAVRKTKSSRRLRRLVSRSLYCHVQNLFSLPQTFPITKPPVRPWSASAVRTVSRSLGTPEAQAEYDRLARDLVLERTATHHRKRRNHRQRVDSRLLEALEQHYRRSDGTPTSELDLVRLALRPVNELYGYTAANCFGPTHSRRSANDSSKGYFAEGRSSTMAHPPDVPLGRRERTGAALDAYGLQAVRGLQRGRTEAKDYAPVRPVPEAWIEAVRPHVASPVRAMIDLQLLTGMRPGEVVIMRGCDLDRSGAIWTYRPKEHKTAHHGHEHLVYLGPKAQEIVSRFLKSKPDAFLLLSRRCPRGTVRGEAGEPENEGSAIAGWKRRTSAAEAAVVDVASYRRAIKYACERAFPLPEHLRPQTGGTDRRTSEADDARGGVRGEVLAEGTRLASAPASAQRRRRSLRKEFGIEAARIILGHRNLRVTEIYAEADREQAMEVVEGRWTACHRRGAGESSQPGFAEKTRSISCIGPFYELGFLRRVICSQQ